MQETSLRDEMISLCDMQVEFWKQLKDSLVVASDSTDEEVVDIWYDCFNSNVESVQSLVNVKTQIDKVGVFNTPYVDKVSI